MSDDDFKAVFFEEAAEHLQAIEDELLILDAEPDSEDALNGVFRAAHSIKGSAGMFGLATLAAFTHHLETLLDFIRKGQATLNEDRVELTLRAADEIRDLVERLVAGEEAPEADQELTEALIAAVAVVKGGTVEPPMDTSELAEDGSFGLFDSDLSDTDDDGFGLFDDEPADDVSDEGFGFFDDPAPLPSPSSNHSAYDDYFDEMFRSGDSQPPTTSGEGEPALPGEDGSSLPAEGKSGGLNKAEKPPEKTSGKAVRPEPASANGSGKGAAPASLRVSLEKVDELVNQISELVITQAMLQETGAKLDSAVNEAHLATLETLERNTRELQESVLSIRLIPVSFLFNRFPRVIRDLSKKLGKSVELTLMGEQTELDKSLIEKLSDPLTHLARNSIDHGVESPEERRKAGKPERGQVVMAAAHEGGNIVISITDDGAGINRSKVLGKARENGLEVDDSWSDEQVFALIFEPGFSTAAEVTDVSGRGVGMDVVKRNIKELGGSIEVTSTQGEGSVFRVRLPLTLAITDGMVVRCGEQRYVIPLSNVVESLQLDGENQFDIQGRSRVIRRHGDYLTLRRLSELLETRSSTPGHQEELAIVVESDGRQIGLEVDELVGQQQIVIKNLEANYRKVAGFSGATVMGDGSVAFILDVSHFVAHGE